MTDAFSKSVETSFDAWLADDCTHWIGEQDAAWQARMYVHENVIEQLSAENAQLKKQEIELKAESERLAELLECAQGDCQQAMQIIERVTPQAELYRQVERAAGELPSGWEIRICIELGAGYVELRDEDGCEVDFPNSCETLGMTVSDAIDAVIGKGERS